MNLLCMELACSTLGYQRGCILEGFLPEEPLPEGFPDKRSRANVMAAYASVYLRQQLLSLFPGDALQSDTVESSSVQLVVHELVHTGLPGYLFHFFWVVGKFSSLQKTDDLLCPCRSPGLDGKD